MSDGIDLTKIMMTLFTLAFILASLPTIMHIFNDGEFPSEEQSQYFNFTIMSKRVEYDRGFFLTKRSFLLILSDGASYRVPKTVFELYDIGDPITIEIQNGKVIFS